MKKRIFVLILVLFTAMSVAFPVAAEWQNVGNEKYYYTSEGRYVKGLYQIDGVMYCFKESGVLMGRYSGFTRNKTSGAKFYYKDGERVVGWMEIDGKSYYFRRGDGAAVGEYLIGRTVYKFDNDGVYTGEKYESQIELSLDKDKMKLSEVPEKIAVKAITYGIHPMYYSKVYSVEKLVNNSWKKVAMPNGDENDELIQMAMFYGEKRSVVKIYLADAKNNLKEGIYRLGVKIAEGEEPIYYIEMEITE